MTKLAGQATVTLNGAILRLLPKVELDPGGVNRKVHVGAGGVINGTTEETVPGVLKAKGQLAAGERLSDFAFEGATVIATMNTGQVFIFRDACTLSTPKWGSGDGEVEVEIGSASGIPEEI